MSLQEREQLSKGNPKIAAPVILKLLGEQPMQIDELFSLTGMPQKLLQQSLEELVSSGLIVAVQSQYRLTDRGEKARFLVAS